MTHLAVPIDSKQHQENCKVVKEGDRSMVSGGACSPGLSHSLRTIYQKLTADGVANLHFLASEGMLGDDTEGTVDGCHPNDLGMMREASAFSKAMSPLLAEHGSLGK